MFFRSRPARNWNAERLQPAFSAHTGLSSAKKSALNVVAYQVPHRALTLSALPASDDSTAVSEDLLQVWHMIRHNPVSKRSRSSTASRSTETCHQIVRHLHLCAPHSLTAMTFARLRGKSFLGRPLRPSSKTEMTRKLSSSSRATARALSKVLSSRTITRNTCSRIPVGTHILHR